MRIFSSLFKLSRHRSVANYFAAIFFAAFTLLVSAATYAAHNPVLMIPGMGGSPANMTTMQSNLAQSGWDRNNLFTWTDADQMTTNMEVSARAISAKVDDILKQTGASRLVLVTWSASTIAGRYYIKNLGGDTKVSQFISFAGPHHGISIWNQCTSQQKACREQWGPSDSPWLKELNSDTEVPGWPNVRYLTLRGSADTNATPVDTAMLAGADENYLANGQSHFSIISNSSSLEKMRSFINKYENKIDDQAPIMTYCSAKVTSDTSVDIKGEANDNNNQIVSYHVQLNGPTFIDDESAGFGPDFFKFYSLTNGTYTGTVTATNNIGKTSAQCQITRFTVGQLNNSEYTPVIIGTGMSGDLSKMGPIKDYLIKNGWKDDRVFLWKDRSEFSGDVPTTAEEVSVKVDEVLRITGESKVVLIGWSSSTIAFRYYIKNLNGYDKVSQYIGIAGPQHGITNYIFCQYTDPACAQWGPPNGSFITELNSGTEVPGSPNVKYLTVRGTSDTNASPIKTAILNGADENAVFSGLTHYTLLTNSAVQAKIGGFIAANEVQDGSNDNNDKIKIPNNLHVTKFTPNSISLAWNTASDAYGYNIYRSTSPNGNGVKINAKMVTSNSFTASELTANTTYYFVVRAQDINGIESGNSNQINQNTGGLLIEKVTAPLYSHYYAQRLTVNQYITLGLRLGFTTPVTLYKCKSGWTDKPNCEAI